MAPRNPDRDVERTPAERLAMAVGIYVRVMAGVMMVLGLREWAIVVGMMSGTAGPFETMPLPLQLATAHFAVVDLVASVGLWQRSAWGNVVWIYAAVAEIVIHTAFVDIFGSDYFIVGFLGLTVVCFLVLVFLLHRARMPPRRRRKKPS